MKDWDTYRSGKGSTLDFIKAGIELPPGNILMEDPPSHDVHRGLLSRVFTPKRMNALEDKVRAFCARSLDPLGRHRSASTSCTDLGAQMPMRTIGMLLGIPEAGPGGDPRPPRRGPAPSSEDGTPRDDSDGVPRRASSASTSTGGADHPSDDLMTELHPGRVRPTRPARSARLTRDEVLTYIMLIAGAGNETATRLIGVDRQAPGRAPRPAPRDRRGPLARPRAPSRRSSATRRRRPCRPGSCPATSSVHGQRVAEGEHHGAAQRLGEPRRPPVPRRRPVRHPPRRSATTSASATASTSASAPPWPASRGGSRSTRCSTAGPSGTSTGTTPSRPTRRTSVAGRSSRSPPADRKDDAMQMDDMILVSIDDHMVEPPDMYENHVPAKWKDQVPKVVRNEQRRRRVALPGPGHLDAVRHGRHRRLAQGGVGLQPRLLLRAAAGLLRRARAGAGHGRQRRAGVDELPDDGRLQRPHVHRGRRQGARARHAPGLQRLGHRRVGRQLPGPVHPPRPRPDVGRRPRGRGGAPPRQEGLPLDQLPRDAARAGLPELPVGPLGPDAQGPLRHEHGPVAAHRRRLRGDPASAGGADRPPHGAGLPDQRDHRAGPAVRPDPAEVPRPARWRCPRAASGGSPSTSTASTATSRTRAGSTAATTSAASCRPRCSASTSSPATSPTRRACCCGTASASTSSPGSATTPTPTRRGPSRRSRPGRSSRTRAAPTRRSTRSPGENACRFFDWDPFEHTKKEDATVGALRAQARAADVDVTRMPRAEWKKQNEAAGIGVLT